MQRNTPVIFVPRDASDEAVLDIVRGWVDVLSQEDYDAVFDALGLSIRGEAPGPECIRGCINYYRSPEYYPGVEEFTVTDWRAAQGGNPEPRREVTRYGTNSIRMAGAVSFDLPLNGRWSDLTADFVFFEDGDPEGCRLLLEEIDSWAQGQRDMAAMEQEHSGAEALVAAIPAEVGASARPKTHRFDVAGEDLSQRQDEGAVLYNDDVSR